MLAQYPIGPKGKACQPLSIYLHLADDDTMAFGLFADPSELFLWLWRGVRTLQSIPVGGVQDLLYRLMVAVNILI